MISMQPPKADRKLHFENLMMVSKKRTHNPSAYGHWFVNNQKKNTTSQFVIELFSKKPAAINLGNPVFQRRQIDSQPLRALLCFMQVTVTLLYSRHTRLLQVQKVCFTLHMMYITTNNKVTALPFTPKLGVSDKKRLQGFTKGSIPHP